MQYRHCKNEITESQRYQMWARYVRARKSISNPFGCEECPCCLKELNTEHAVVTVTRNCGHVTCMDCYRRTVQMNHGNMPPCVYKCQKPLPGRGYSLCFNARESVFMRDSALERISLYQYVHMPKELLDVYTVWQLQPWTTYHIIIRMSLHVFPSTLSSMVRGEEGFRRFHSTASPITSIEPWMMHTFRNQRDAFYQTMSEILGVWEDLMVVCMTHDRAVLSKVPALRQMKQALEEYGTNHFGMRFPNPLVIAKRMYFAMHKERAKSE